MVFEERFFKYTSSVRMNQVSTITADHNEVSMGIGLLYAIDSLNKMTDREADGHNTRQMSYISSQRSAIRGDTSRINPTGLTRIKHRFSTFVGLGADGTMGNVRINAGHTA